MGVAAERWKSAPRREMTPRASQRWSGADLPLAVNFGSSSKLIAREVRRCVVRPATTPMGGASARRRAAVFTESPTRNPSPELGTTRRRTRARPVLTPTRTCSRSSARGGSLSIASTMARPARTPRSASSSCAVGTPKAPTTASPMNFSTVPPKRSMMVRAASKNARRALIHVLRVVAFAESGGVADEIGEERGHDPALGGGAHRRGERDAARRAEAGAARGAHATGRT